MNSLTLPKLYCPFAFKIHDNVDILENYAIDWAQRFNLIKDELDYQKFYKTKIFLLAANAYPFCKLENLQIVTDFLSWILTWDDEADVSALGKEPEVIENLHQRFLEILDGADITSEDIPHSLALHDLRQRMLQKGKEKTFANFVNSFDFYIHGCVQEVLNWKNGYIPHKNNYIILRRATGVMEPLIDLIELCIDWKIPDFIRKHETIQKLRMVTNDIGWCCNDIFSLAREIKNGDVNNIVIIIHKKNNISLEEALNIAVDFHDEKINELIDLEASLPSFGEDIDAEINKYISGLNSWIIGHFNWYAHSGRYKIA